MPVAGPTLGSTGRAVVGSTTTPADRPGRVAVATGTGRVGATATDADATTTAPEPGRATTVAVGLTAIASVHPAAVPRVGAPGTPTLPARADGATGLRPGPATTAARDDERRPPSKLTADAPPPARATVVGHTAAGAAATAAETAVTAVPVGLVRSAPRPRR